MDCKKKGIYMSSRRNKLIYIIVLTKSDVFKWLTLYRMQTHECTFHLRRDAMLLVLTVELKLFSFQRSICQKEREVGIASLVSIFNAQCCWKPDGVLENQNALRTVGFSKERQQRGINALSRKNILLEKTTKSHLAGKCAALAVPHALGA